ncbi:MAG TPA: CbtB domain-containing protein [Candidatus Binatia bacterium]|jgi:hypothetical protein
MATSYGLKVAFRNMKDVTERQQVTRWKSLDSDGALVRGYVSNAAGDMKMEKIVNVWLGLAVSEQTSFLIKSGIFLSVCGATLFVALAASYPAVHDTLHNVRHALAIVPCH